MLARKKADKSKGLGLSNTEGHCESFFIGRRLRRPLSPKGFAVAAGHLFLLCMVCLPGFDHFGTERTFPVNGFTLVPPALATLPPSRLVRKKV